MRIPTIVLCAFLSLGCILDDYGEAMFAVRDMLRAEYGGQAALFRNMAEVDLDRDGDPEVIAWVRSERTCGSAGCTLLVYDYEDGQPTQIGRIPATRLPIGIYPERTKGFRDLAVSTEGGGFPAAIRRVPFGDGAYLGSAFAAETRAELAMDRVVIAAQPAAPSPD